MGLARLKAGSHIPVVHADDQPSPEQIAVLRRMTPAERWAVAHRLYWTARRHKAAWLRAQHPDWTEQQVEAETRRVFLYARD